jgi:methyltransferase (TIGR00027 family)
MFTSLKSINYEVADLAGARQWYCALLGAQPLFETPFMTVFRVGDCSLLLSQGKEPLPAGTERALSYWEVNDIDSAYQRLIGAGATPHLAVTSMMNITFARVSDPFGNIIGITHTATDAKEQSVDNKPSQTAMMVALCRALAAKDDREAIRGPDGLAELFLTDDNKRHLRDCESRKLAIRYFVPSWLYGYVISRTVFFDDKFNDALSNKIPQIVFLGAGYDTRAYRYRDMLRNTRVFELDIDSTQQRKRAVLDNAKIDIPPQVSFVRIDFKIDNIHDVLKNAGFDDSAETLFIWEGVTYYLSAKAIGNTLDFIRKHSPRGSALCFDYMTGKFESANPGEPCQFWISPEKIEPFLAEYGIDIIDHVDSKEMERRYLTLADGSSAETLLPLFRFVYGMRSA